MSPFWEAGLSFGGLVTAYLIPLGVVKISGAAEAGDTDAAVAATKARPCEKNVLREEASTLLEGDHAQAEEDKSRTDTLTVKQRILRK